MSKGKELSKEIRAEMTKALEQKKAHLYDLDKLVFLPNESALGLRERLRQEIITMEKELGL